MVKNDKRFIQWILTLCCMYFSMPLHAQQTYFVDGYHGGVYGHYPLWQTQFMADTLRKYPDWKINLEIEPETWDSVALKDPAGYKNFQDLFKDSSTASRIEFVNPAYGQSYLYTASGESMIRQFYYGIKKIKEHFPQANFITYSSEEPCFTSALPQVLKSFGFKYAVLKNPNTCWGGYTRANGNEIVNWIGPDGTSIPTVTRYASEALEKNSTWQTTAWNNSNEYIRSAFAAGIQHPVGMCLQDAGWKNGRWLMDNKKRSVYTTWRNYFSQVADTNAVKNWHLSQEDIQVSLVWGAQVLQRIAQQVRAAENKIIVAEKIAALNKIITGDKWPETALDKAWHDLLLSQHHDCWIVPYNGHKGETWADKVKIWTGNTQKISDSIIKASTQAIGLYGVTANNTFTVFNTLGMQRNELVQVPLPALFKKEKALSVKDRNKIYAAQIVTDERGQQQLLFNAAVPSFGFKTFVLENVNTAFGKAAKITLQSNGNYLMETDLYMLIIDPAKGGTIKKLFAKKLNKEFVDTANTSGFNMPEGNFFNEGGMHNAMENKAAVRIVENGPLRIKLEISNAISAHDYMQTIILVQGQARIDFNIQVNWKHNTGIGEDYMQSGGYEAKDLHKAFYNDRCKLLLLFPLMLKDQEVHVDAPFDVTTSKLDNTFFSRWGSIKNNVVLGWVDVTDKNNNYGMALFTDHTTSYAHGKDFPLGLTVQYSGKGLWGRNYTIDSATSVNYSILPHAGDWRHARVYNAEGQLNEPLIASPGGNINKQLSLINYTAGQWQLSSFIFEDDHSLLRLFNAGNDNKLHTLQFAFKIRKAVLVQLNGKEIKELKIENAGNKQLMKLSIPSMGFCTIKIYR